MVASVAEMIAIFIILSSDKKSLKKKQNEATVNSVFVIFVKSSSQVARLTAGKTCEIKKVLPAWLGVEDKH
jgi:hypothetical protein